MIASARSLYILSHLTQHGIIDYKSIAMELGISEATARRDFEKLEKQGKLKRVQGGAMRSGGLDNTPNVELTMRSKRMLNSREKLAVAKAAAEEVRDGECVFLDIGTSIAPLADLLIHRHVRIVTYSNLVVQRTTLETVAEVFVIGGKFVVPDGMFVGPMAENMMGNFHFDRAFIGCSGYSLAANTVYTTEMECMRMKQLATANSTHSYLLLDTTKLKKTGVFSVAGAEKYEKVFINTLPETCKLPPNFVQVGSREEIL
jgi:DeoR/GlpR family transcriptional regulator of sugar metabolism